MSFDSIFYLSCFLPVTLILYAVIPGTKAKNIVLLLIGLLFYSFGSFSGIILLLISAGVNFLLGLLVQKEKFSKPAMIAGVSANLAFLFAYKYLDFVLAQIFPFQKFSLGLIAPIGISFFTFKNISYLIDVYRDPSTATNRPHNYLLYLSFFPQIMAGPITRYKEFSQQLTNRKTNLSTIADGVQRFIIGLCKKVLLCTALGKVADHVFGLDAGILDIRLAWLGAIAYMLQIYFDFSGYSDMAIGMGNMLGFHTPENFNYPYIAASIGDFWRRWHISLSSWFKDYLYIPLGGNRKGNLRAAFNKATVFTLCGLWHGCGWTYLLWGAWHGLFSALESLSILNPKKMPKPIAHLYTLLVVCIGFVMFRAESLQQGFQILCSMFSGFSFSTAGNVALHQIVNAKTIVALLLGFLFSCPIAKKINCPATLRYALCLIAYCICLAALASGGFTPFIYFQF